MSQPKAYEREHIRILIRGTDTHLQDSEGSGLSKEPFPRRKGVWNKEHAAMLAPTAINQQRFYIEQVGERGARAKALIGPCSKTDLGIVKYHFELGAGRENFEGV